MSIDTSLSVDEYLTPFKLENPVLVGSGIPLAFDELAVDCPFVFEHNDKFYMMYVGFDGNGYQTALATSEDLIQWSPLGTILSRDDRDAWDSRNAAGCWILKENELNAPAKLKKWDNKYWLVYHSYPGVGYEAGPASIGLAWTEDESLMQWNRLAEPILTAENGESWEIGGLYKECLIENEGRFYMFYNAKNKPEHGSHWIEQIGLATSTDMFNWTRNENNPLLRVSDSWDSLFVSDPCIVLDGDRWLMFYFGYNGIHAQEGLAISTDLLHWHKHAQPIITVGEAGSIDTTLAHKPAIIKHNGILYHFYCACRPSLPGDRTINDNEFRTIAVAVSESLT